MSSTAILFFLALAGMSVGDPAPDLRLELLDQYGNAVAYPLDGARASGSVVLIAAADRRGADANVEWAKELAARYAPHIDGRAEPSLVIVPVAHLGSVPRLFRGLVRRMFRRTMVDGEPLIPIALDWHGQVERQLGLEPAVPNLTVLDDTGRVQVQRAGEVGSHRDAVFEVLDRLLWPEVTSGAPSPARAGSDS